MGTPFKMKGSPMQRNFGISPVKQDAIKIMKKSTLSPEDLKSSKDTIVSAGDAKAQRFGGYGWDKDNSLIKTEKKNPNITRDGFNLSDSQWNSSNSIGHGVNKKMDGEGFNELQNAGNRSSKRVNRHYEQEDIKKMSKVDVAQVNKDLQKAMYKPLPK
jgi:hypothetical protein